MNWNEDADFETTLLKPVVVCIIKTIACLTRLGMPGF